MIFHTKRRQIYLIILAAALGFFSLSTSEASPPGTVPFGFFKAVVGWFDSIGAYPVPSNSFVSGETFTSGSLDRMFSFPNKTAYDATNNAIYISDAGNNRIVKVTATTGAFVGAIGNTSSSTGTCPASGAASGWCTGGKFVAGSGDGMFNTPAGIAYDSVNNAIYVIDKTNSRVVKVNATTGAFVGAMGNTSSSTGTCPASGAATGWCTGGVFTSGSGNGMFNSAEGIAYDNTNNAIYVADSSNYRVVKVTATTGAFVGAIGNTSSSTGTCPASGAATGWCTGGVFVTGTGDGMFYATAGVAYDATNNSIYISEAFHRIVKVTATTGAFVGTIGNTTSSSGTCPASGAATAWCTGGVFTFGIGDGMFKVPGGLAYDNNNNAIYISDSLNNRIVKVTASTGTFVGAIGNTSSSTGTCPASGAATGWCTGGIFISGSGNGLFNNPTGVAYDSTNNAIYIIDNSNNRLVKVTATTGAFLGADGAVVTAIAAWGRYASPLTGVKDGMFSGPNRSAYDSTNNALYIVDGSNHRILKFNAITGAFVGAIGKTTSSTGTCPASGAATGWCTGGVFGSGSGNGMFNFPSGVAYDSTNNTLYIADNRRVVKVTATTGAFVGAIGNTSSSTGTCPASGAAAGWCTGGVFVSGTGNGMFNSPSDVTYDSTNNAIYITDTNSRKIVKVTATTGAFVGAIGKTISTTGTCPASGAATGWCTGGFFGAGTGDGMFDFPIGVTYDSTNNAIYIADSNNNRVVKVTATTGAFVGAIGKTTSTSGTCPASGAATVWCTGGVFASGTGDGMFSSVSDVTYDSTNNAIYIADSSNNRVVKTTATTGTFVGAIGKTSSSTGTCPGSAAASTWCTGGVFTSGNGAGMFNYPKGITYDSTNNKLYISDSNNDRVVRKTPP